VLVGTARLEDGITRVAGARVLVQWPKPAYAVGGDAVRLAETLTDSLGGYVVCGVEEFVDPTIAALAVEAQSGAVIVPAGVGPITRVDLLLGQTNAPATTLHGQLVDGEGRPVPGMSVSVEGTEETSDADGRFALPGIRPGSRMRFVRGIGYTPLGQAVEVAAHAPTALRIPLEKVVVLPGVTTTVRTSTRRECMEFEWRRRAGWTRIVDSLDIQRSPLLRNTIEMVPGVRTVAGAGSTFTIRGRFGCLAHVYVDGVQSDFDEVSILPRENLAAVEIYSSVAFAPVRFISVRADDCAVALFWTKARLAP
jgi:hypothetical protein